MEAAAANFDVTRLPRALLLDLDDTIVDDSSGVEESWRDACSECQVDRLLAEIASVRDWFWSDPDRHRIGRLDLAGARRKIVRMAMKRIGVEDERLVDDIASRYETLRDKRLRLLPGAVETIQWFRSTGRKTALLTNGAGAAQRSKITRFNLEPLFDVILIEGELGYGKPDHRVFRSALSLLKRTATETWMIGDNLDWDIAPAKALGMPAIWVDAHWRGLPDRSLCRPDYAVKALNELLPRTNVDRL